MLHKKFLMQLHYLKQNKNKYLLIKNIIKQISKIKNKSNLSK